MRCEILSTRKTGQELAGTLSLRDGEITAERQKGYERLMANILEETVWVEDQKKKVTKEDDPRLWFAILPREYSGTYLRALLIEDQM
jgi:hypothetical protein